MKRKQPHPLLSPEQIHCLLSHQIISTQLPWLGGQDEVIENHLRTLCTLVMQKTRTESKIEWDHYGCGYASFVDAWFYRPTADFYITPLTCPKVHCTGLVVLLSRLSPYFVLMEANKFWDDTGDGGGYLPDFRMLDDFKNPAVIELASQVQILLEEQGLIRAYKEQLSERLPVGLEVPTILADFDEQGFTQYDALFHWED
ncbi:hypothetical protein HZU77_015580 [Neisseriaceae bacterium TC5R-5]|nr:hypothetical protein [Neisseriaceae bacterium TC5R-5]